MYSFRLLVRGDEPLIHDLAATIGRHRAMFLLNNLKVTEGLASVDQYEKGWTPTQASEGDYYGIFGPGGELTGVVAHFWNNNLVVHVPFFRDNETSTKQTVRSILAAFHSRNRSLEGVLGHEDEAAVVLDVLQATFPQLSDTSLWCMNSTDIFMELHLSDSIMDFPTDARCRHVLPKDVPEETMISWLSDFETSTLGYEEANIPRIKSRIDAYVQYDPDSPLHSPAARPRAWVLVDENNVPVSIAGMSCRIDGVVQIGPVYTPPEHRRKGYARTILAKLLQEEYRHGWTQQAVLMADDPYAIRCYEVLGFRTTGHYRIALLQNPLPLSIVNEETHEVLQIDG
eukprot:gene6100-4380_t